ncbi:MAG: helix-turn-helix domain-containing protein [Candidatus Accumulibacter sp.]|jgi:transcriptional regulator with XRE-family HTH domain|nr:helix-turn-helix domain-containing protein [Accumulibacter sp.]
MKNQDIAQRRRELLKAEISKQGLSVVARRANKPDRQINDMAAGRKSFGAEIAAEIGEMIRPDLPRDWLIFADFREDRYRPLPTIGEHMMTTGEKIREERERKKWTQQELADEIKRIKKSSLSRESISQWESDSAKQTPENFFAVADALGLNPRWLLDGSGEKYASSITESKTENVFVLHGSIASAQKLVSENKKDISSGSLEEADLLKNFRNADSSDKKIILLLARELGIKGIEKQGVSRLAKKKRDEIS